MHPPSKSTHHHRSSSSSSIVPLINNNHHPPVEATRRKARTTFLLVSLALFALFSAHQLHLSKEAEAGDSTTFRLVSTVSPTLSSEPVVTFSYVMHETESIHVRHVSSIEEETIDTVSILFPAWEVLLVAPPDAASSATDGEIHCVFETNATSPARIAGVLPFTNRTMFRCDFPPSVRRKRPFYQPVLTRSESPEKAYKPPRDQPEELFRWNFLAYESLSTEEDIVLFVKGVNNRQGINRSPSELNCIFGDDPAEAVRTPVTSSAQEVFRCPHPELTDVKSTTRQAKIRISLEIRGENRVIPSVAYYIPSTSRNNTAFDGSRSLLCACTMVHNVAKFLKEWVMYHSEIGVERFLLYDNDSNDDLESVVADLNGDGYDVRTVMWPWPKTQEAGFSHGAVYANRSCSWMMYVDVDEYIFTPSWSDSMQPSKHMLESLLPSTSPETRPPSRRYGQVSFNCYEFGPSHQKFHPPEGVTQGYTCRRKLEQRHKSIVLLNAVDESLLNVIHHFNLKEGYRSKQAGSEVAVVNHYKYQAWSEFKTKFRRRVSAYVVDWTQAVNPMSKDRAPGLGFQPIEPPGWADKFCEVTDDRLKFLTRRWFGSNSSDSEYQMAWQRR